MTEADTVVDAPPKDWHIRPDCRLCGSAKLDTVLQLQPTPPANEFVRDGDPPQELIPLYLARCETCGHVQLPVVVDPERLFRNYVYVSGTSPVFVEHFKKYARDCVEVFDLKADDLVVDAGSNDGTLLFVFKLLGMAVQGVDPAREIAARATKAGIDTIPEFFTRETAQKIRWQHGKSAALVVANNVFAHADDLRSIALGVRDLLDPQRGRFVFENSYLVDVIEKTLFDTIYHEHLSFHSLGPLVPFFDGVGMSLVDAERIDTHGGSIRCTVCPGRGLKMSLRMATLLDRESRLLVGSPFARLAEQVWQAKEHLQAFLRAEQQAGHVVAGYGAPAKLTTLCHEFGITRADIAYVVDDSPWKQDRLTPGTLIPVQAFTSHMVERDRAPSAFVIFAWNFAESIANKLRAAGFRGKIVVPLPEFKEIA